MFFLHWLGYVLVVISNAGQLVLTVRTYCVVLVKISFLKCVSHLGLKLLTDVFSGLFSTN